MFSAVHLLSFVKFVALSKKLLNNYMIADLSAHPVHFNASTENITGEFAPISFEPVEFDVSFFVVANLILLGCYKLTYNHQEVVTVVYSQIHVPSLSVLSSKLHAELPRI